jgi:nucleoside-diphosphate-sugar epimerase
MGTAVNLDSARIVVTGAGGVIGSRLVGYLAGCGARVTAVDMRPPAEAARLAGVRYVVADIGAPDMLREQLGGADIVYHLAYLMGQEANADPVLATRVNALGGASILQACLDARVGRLLLASSVSVFGSTRDYPQDQLPLGDRAARLGSKGISVYGAGKVYLELLAEHYSRQHGLSVGGLRPGAVIGCSRTTGRAQAVANIVATAATRRHVVIANGKAAFPAIHVDDVVGAFVALATIGPDVLREQAFFNMAGDYATMRSFCDEVARLVPEARFDIADGEEDELFGTTAFVKDDGVSRMVGYQRRYRSLREAIGAELDELSAASRSAPMP